MESISDDSVNHSFMQMNLPQTPFLSFLQSYGNGIIGENILSFIARGTGGCQTILNLRKVCSTTKSWVDKLSAAQIRRYFPEMQVSIFLCKRTLGQFALTSPTFNVTSLRLENSPYIHGYSNIYTFEEEKLIRSFVDYWSPKLELLETECVSTMLEKYFCSASQLKSIRFQHLNSFCPIVLQLENLSVDNYKGSCPNEISYFSRMAALENLKNFEIISRTKAFAGLTVLINAKRHDKHFKLTVNLEFEQEEPERTRETQEEPSLAVLKDFVCAVTSSSSSVCLMGLTDYGLSKIMEATQNQSMVENFLKRVAWFKVWHFKKFPFTVELLKRNCFPNLKRFDECCAHDSQEATEIFDFPRGLCFLTIYSKCLFTRHFPKSLKYLDMNVKIWTVIKLQEAICKISDSCPSLEEIKITWCCKSPIRVDELFLS